MSEAYGTYGGEERCIQGFGGKAVINRPSGRSRCGWEDNINIDLQEVGWGAMVWNDLARDRERSWALVNVVMNLRVP
jgi:hypothetical protein